MINAALPLYVWERREDGGEPGSISIPPVLLQESALSLYRCSAAFQITEKTHQTLQFGFTPSTPPPPQSCLLLPYEPIYAFRESVLGCVCVFSSSISCVNSPNLSKLSVNLRLFDCNCLIVFSEGRERQTGLDPPGKSECGAGWGRL